jgi:hypothetical protein
MKKITFILFALFTCWQINAQVSSYAFTESTETYAQITGTTSTATGDDGSQNTIAIGFTFKFGGVDYTTFSVNTNGWIRLGNTIGTGSFTNSLANAATYRPLIAVFWDDNNMTGGEIRYSVTGTAPNQVLTVNWHNSKIGGFGSTAGAAVSTLLRLYETTNVIEMVYSNPFTTGNTVTASVGLNDATSFLSVTPAATSTVSSATANDAINATVMANLAGKKIIFTPPSCAAPAGFVASALTATTATIAWNAASPVPSTGYEYYYSSINTAPSAAGTPTSNLTENLTGLSVNTPYYVWLRSDCGGGTFSAWAGPFTFATPCNPYSVPYFEGFESGYTHNVAVAGCISQATLTGTQVWTANSTFTDRNRTPRTGSFNAFLQYSNEDWMFIPIDLVGGTSYRVSLYARQDGATAANSNIAISYGTANNNAAMTNAIVAATGIIDGTYQEIVGDFVPATSGTYYVGIKGFMNGTPWYISLDDISITESPSCLNPTSIIASNITSNSVDLSWTDGSGGLQFDYEYAIQAPGTGVPASAGAQVGDVTIAGEGFDINGDPLAANTLYEVYVRSDCGGGDFSPWVGPITFRTLCESIITFPFTETFENASTSRDCWSNIQEVGTSNWTYNTGSSGGAITTAFEGTLNARFVSTTGTASPITKLVSPVFDFSTLTSPRLKFNYGQESWFGDQNELKVYYRISSLDPWVEIGYYSTNIASWTEVVLSLPNPSATYQIAFEGINNFGRANVVDNVIIEETPLCPEPTGLTVMNITDTTADFSWTATTGNYEYVLDINAADPAGAGTPISGETYNATLLTPETTYYFHVRTDCGSTWTTISFTTLPTPPVNDDCLNPQVLTPGGVFATNAVIGTTVAATTVTSLTYGCQTNRANEVWYSVVVPPSGTITIETQADGASALTDTVLSVFSGTCGALVEVGCDDDTGVGNFSILNLTQPAGTTLYIGVWRWSNATNGTFKVSAYDASLSSGSFNNANFSAYPNPVKDVLNISYTSEISSVRVINMIGQEVLSKNINATSSQVDMSQLSAGTYIVNVTVGDAIKTLKVVKQ